MNKPTITITKHICPTCGAERVNTSNPEDLMKEFTETHKSRIFNVPEFDNWFFSKFGEPEDNVEIHKAILNSCDVERIDGVVLLYKSPYEV